MIRRTTVTRHMRVLPHTKSGAVKPREMVDPTRPFFFAETTPVRCRLRLCKLAMTGRLVSGASVSHLQYQCPKCGRVEWRKV